MIGKRVLLTWVISATVTTVVVVSPSVARAQSARAAMAASYLERGNAWFAKGEWERAIADYDLAGYGREDVREAIAV